MAKAEWGVDPEFFGPRHAHREDRIVRCLEDAARPGLHLECAAGVGSLTISLASRGFAVVATDSSLRSLAFLARRAATGGRLHEVVHVVADATALPFADGTFSSATSAETLEHIENDSQAVAEMARTLKPGSWLVGTVPAGPDRWSAWDDWAGHLRRYTPEGLKALLTASGFEAEATTWGWPVLRIYDGLFLKPINRRRLEKDGSVDDDPALRRVAGLARNKPLVALVKWVFSIDRLFDGCRWGVGLLFAARKPSR